MFLGPSPLHGLCCVSIVSKIGVEDNLFRVFSYSNPNRHVNVTSIKQPLFYAPLNASSVTLYGRRIMKLC